MFQKWQDGHFCHLPLDACACSFLATGFLLCSWFLLTFCNGFPFLHLKKLNVLCSNALKKKLKKMIIVIFCLSHCDGIGAGAHVFILVVVVVVVFGLFCVSIIFIATIHLTLQFLFIVVFLSCIKNKTVWIVMFNAMKQCCCCWCF